MNVEFITNLFSQEQIIQFLQKYGFTIAVATAISVVAIAFLKAIPILFKKDDTEDPEYFISLKNVEEMRKRVKTLRFSAYPDFWDADAKELQACYNGVGPSSWSPKYRKFIAKLIDSIEGSVLIHDYEWKNCDRTLFCFIMINLKFICNTVREAKDRKNWRIALIGPLLSIINWVFGWRLFKDDIL